MARDDVREVLVAMGLACESDAVRGAVAVAIRNIVGDIAEDGDEGRGVMARDDVRAVLVAMGLACESDVVRAAVADAIRNIAASDEGGRVMARDDVRATLLAMGACGVGEGVLEELDARGFDPLRIDKVAVSRVAASVGRHRLIAQAVALISATHRGRRVLATEAVCGLLVGLWRCLLEREDCTDREDCGDACAYLLAAISLIG